MELIENLLQLLVTVAGAGLSGIAYYKNPRQTHLLLLLCFYSCFALGDLYWTLYLLLFSTTPQVFYVSEFGWVAGVIFLRMLQATLSNLIWCGMMIVLSFCAIRGLDYASGQEGAARDMRYFHIGVLCFVFSEYLLWTVGCFWPDTSPTDPAFWCDILLTLAIFGLLPATGKAVRA